MGDSPALSFALHVITWVSEIEEEGRRVREGNATTEAEVGMLWGL